MQVNINEKIITMSDFLIVGAAKSGTTSLYHYLKQHPQIFMPKNKEPWFFSFAGADKKDEEIFNKKKDIVTDFDDYLSLFNDAKDSQISGEASTVYLYLYGGTIENIKKYHPNWKNLKIVIIIRNPVERAFSHYLDDSLSGSLNMTLEEIIERWRSKQLPRLYNHIDYGFYYNQIKAYKDNFDQVKVCLFDDLKDHSLQLIQDLFSFLGVSDSFIPDTSLKYNTSTGSKGDIFKYRFISNLINKPNPIKKIVTTLLPEEFRVKIENMVWGKLTKKKQMESATTQLLKGIFKEDICKLQILINRNLSQWLN